MNNSDGRIWYGASLDYSDLQKGGKQVDNIFKGIGDTAQKEGVKIDNIFKKISAGVAGYFSVRALKDFATEVVNVRGQFQQLEIAFSTMLKSEEKATTLMSELSDFAARTPFGLESAASGAKQLIAYGSTAESVIGELEMLGDVAAGTGQQIGDLVYLYGTLRTQGKAYTMDIRQFAGRGIPIYDELAKVLGTTKDQVNDFVSAGKVGFSEIEQAFKNMTASGGMYGGLMEAQSKSVTGRMEQLKDAIDVMFNNIGKSSEGAIYSAIDTASSLVENYETVGKVLLSLIATYGAYKAAVMLAAVAENGWTVTQLAHYRALLLVEKAQKLVNATMRANPYVLVATAIVGIGTALWVLKDRTTEAEKAQERYNQKLEEVAEQEKENKRITDELVETATNQALADHERSGALEKLKEKYPQIFEMYDIEKLKLADILKLKQEIAEADSKEKSKNEEADFEKQLANVKRLEDLIKKAPKQTGEQRLRIKGYEKELAKAKDDLQLTVNDRNKNRVNQYIADLTGISDEELEKQLEERKSLLSKITEAQKKGVKTTQEKSAHEFTFLSKENVEDQIKALETQKTIREELEKNRTTGAKELAEANKELARLQKERNGIIAANLTPEERKAQLEAIDEQIKTVNEKIKLLGGDQKTLKAASKNADEISKAILASEKALAKARLDVMKDGKNKRLAQSQQEFKETKAQIEKEQKDLEKLLGRKLTTKEQQVFVERQAVNAESKDERDKEINKDYEKEVADRLRAITDITKAEEKKRRDEIKKRYDDERKWANEQLATGGMTEVQHTEFISKSNESEQKEQLDRILANVEDFKRQEEEIIAKYDSLINDESIASNTELQEKLRAEKEKAVSEIKAQAVQASDDWLNLFANLDTMTAEQIDEVVANIEGSLKGLNLSPEALKALVEQLKKAKDVSYELKTANPFKGVIVSVGDYRKALEKLKTAQEALNKAKEEGASDKGIKKLENDVNQATKTLEEAARRIAATIGDVNDVFGSVSGAFTDILGSFGNDELAETVKGLTGIASGAMTAGQGVAQIASGDVVGGITSLASGIANVVTGIVGMGDSKRQKNIERIQKTIDNLEDSVQRLKKRYEELGRAADEAFSSSKADILEEQNRVLQKEMELRKKQNAEIQKQIREEKDKKKTDDDAIRSYEYQIKANKEANEEARRQMEENKKAAIDAITGTSIMSAIDEFTNAYVDAWAQGETAAYASAKVVKNIVKKAITEAMKDDLSGVTESYMNKLSEYLDNDGIISSYEQSELDKLEAQMNEIASKYEDRIKEQIDKEQASGVTGELKQEMTEGTASQLVGLWNMTAMDIRAIKEYIFANGLGGSTQLVSPAEIYSLIQFTKQIVFNTENTANNTARISEMVDTVKEIKNSLTKSGANNRTTEISRG